MFATAIAQPKNLVGIVLCATGPSTEGHGSIDRILHDLQVCGDDPQFRHQLMDLFFHKPPSEDKRRVFNRFVEQPDTDVLYAALSAAKQTDSWQP